MKEDGGISVRAHVVEKICLQNFDWENLRHETILETQAWMGDNINPYATNVIYIYIWSS